MAEGESLDQDFCCDRCAEFFPESEMVEDDGLYYCKACYLILLEGGEI